MVVDLDKGGRQVQIRRTYLGPTKGYIETDEPGFIEFVIESNQGPFATGYKGGLLVPLYLSVVSWAIFLEQSASVVIDVWKVSQADYLAGTVPTVANTITGSNIPNVSGAVANQDDDVSTWTTEIKQNDFVAFNVNVNSGALKCTIVLQCVKNIGQWSGVGTS